VLTPIGEKIMQKIIVEEKEKILKKGSRKQNWQLIVAVIGVIVTIVIYLISKLLDK
jgi:hypothetical protein